MSDDLVRRIADAVLYEGYILWPYRRSALKNQRRWTFGGVYPETHAAAHPDDAAVMRRVVDRVHAERGVDMEPTAGQAHWRRRLMRIGHDPLKPVG